MFAPIQPAAGYKAQTKILTLTPGLYLFQYAAPSGQEAPSVAVVTKAPLPTTGTIAFLGQGDEAQPVLQNPGERFVARVDGGAIQVLLTLVFPDEIIDPSVQILIERLDGVQPGPGQPNAAAGMVALPVSLNGHVQLQGDVAGTVGGWVGEPDGHRRVEGFTVLWPNRPDGVDISYSCTVDGFGRTPATLTGGFVGTRRRAAPILGVSMALVGENASRYELRIEAAFAGSGVRQGMGGYELTGPSGAEALVGLRVLVVSAAAAEKPLAPLPEIPAPSVGKRNVRTFVPQL